MNASDPASRHVVLVGGGHSHVTVVKSFGMKREPGVVVTLIAKELHAPYSGMLPGLIAGHYTYDECHIDLVRLTSWAGVRLIHGSATGIDRASKRVLIEGRPSLGYDLLSIDVGITPKLDSVPGAAAHGIAVKPVSTFFRRWSELERAALTPGGPRRIVLIGAGAAGFELILAIRHRFLTRASKVGIDPTEFAFCLIGSGGLLPTHNKRARKLARRFIAEHEIDFVEGDRAVQIEPTRVALASGAAIDADAVLLSTEAGPAEWFGTTDLPKDERGFLAARPTLQLLDDDDVFAVGDCATILEHKREKAGVFAVRQGPPLTENLRRRARGATAEPFVPQTEFLTLLSTGGKHAIAARNGLALAGKWVWKWKDHIDRTFVDKFNVLPSMADSGSQGHADMRCAGCAAKVGPVTLSRALDRLGGEARERDDVAIIDDDGTHLRLETLDFFRAFWPEPYLLGEIAAVHGMNDVLAKGGRPTHALANVVLPYAKPARVEEDLFQLLAGAKSSFGKEDIVLVGGHSSEGAELAAGFFVSGSVKRDRLIGKRGMKPGDKLILTRPLGTGILFAALMRGQARGEDIVVALETMRRTTGSIARATLEFSPTAGTDITGFGLVGHLSEMLNDDAGSIELDLQSLPLYPGVLRLARSGITSTLLPENLQCSSSITGAAANDAAVMAILFDPQTAGGFVFTIAEDLAEACLTAVRHAGAEHAAIIGRVVKGSPAATSCIVVTGELNG
ncbi:MAG: selenide, water dikinase SelD [Beijerinckiaceae bacterium]|nr:selenide, water dikinase SelD [Beijerinckiaceae bacterium]